MKFVITGGHHNSALVLAKELAIKGHHVEWIGHRNAAAGDLHDSAEFIEVTASKLHFHNLVAGKTALSFKNIFNVPLGIIRAARILKQVKPDAVISFGGYLGLAVSLAANLQGIPIFLHEQTVIAGKANKVVARIAKRVYLTWESSLRYYPKGRAVVVGLPLRPGFLTARTKKLFSVNKPTLLILGGKQGSHVINKLVFAHLPELLAKYNLIHQTGTSSVTGDYEEAVSLKESLPTSLTAGYDPRGYITEAEIAVCMKSADLVIGRSGAHTTYELGVLGKKALLIPFLHTHGREQLQNARLLEQAGIAAILPQSKLSYPKLEQEIALALHRKLPAPLNLPRDASSLMTSDILKYLS